MEQVIRQLERARRLGRLMLVAQNLMQWTAAVLAGWLALGIIDYALRLPGWLRLCIALAAGSAATSWLIAHLSASIRFKPDLTLLALRVERLIPPLAGILASGVEFALNPQPYASSQATASFAETSIRTAKERLGDPNGPRLRTLINPKRTLVLTCVLVLTTILSGSVILAAPGASLLATRRWFNPLGNAQWPKRTQITSLVDTTVWPDDTPLLLKARVDRGYRRNMRAWVAYQIVGAENGEGTKLLLTDQSGSTPKTDRPEDKRANTFTRMIEFDALQHTSNFSVDRHQRSLEFRFEAGDDRSPTQRVKLVPRPAVEWVDVHLDPPLYAQGLVSPQRIDFDPISTTEIRTSTISALIGTVVTIQFGIRGNIAPDLQDWANVLPGFAQAPNATFGHQDQTIEARFTLVESLQSQIHLLDEHHLTNMSEQVYRIEAIEDTMPTVSLVTPAGDEAVLPMAVIELEAVARDDLGVELLWLEATGPHRGSADPKPIRLGGSAGRKQQMNLHHELDLSPLSLQTGDSLALTAVARDVFQVEGRRHDPVRSSSRIIHIINAATLVQQIRTELAGLRQQAIRLETRQVHLMDLTPLRGESRQRELGRRLETQGTLVQSLKDRIQRNRLDDEHARPLTRLLGQTAELLGSAKQSSAKAVEQLKQSQQSDGEAALKFEQEARYQQQLVRNNLAKLAQLLDQGNDVLALQLQLQELRSQQSDLASGTRRLLPQTLGQNLDQLDASQRRQLAELAEHQKALALQERSLTSRMQSTSQLLARQSEDPQNQAAAMAMAEAAAIAQRQGLGQDMQRAAELTQQNRLSAASQQQSENVDVLEQMLNQFDNQAQRQQEILRRQLLRLAEIIKKLSNQQKAQLTRLATVTELTGLAEPLSTLWRNTLSVEAKASKMHQTQPVALLLGQAASHQTIAIAALRQSQADAAGDAERAALARLEESLQLVQQMNQKLDDQLAQEARERLIQAYRKLADQQRQLRNQTEPHTGPATSRRQRMKLLQIGDAQSDLRDEANRQRDEINQTLVFMHLHDQIDITAQRVIERLRSAQPDAATLSNQDQIAMMFEIMANALKAAQREDPFASGGTGNGAGGGAAASSLVPPLAELRLLRGLQQDVYRRTRNLDKQELHTDNESELRKQLQRLATEQRQLAGLGQQLIEQTRNTLEFTESLPESREKP